VGNGDVAMHEAGQVGQRQTGVALQDQIDGAQAAQVGGRDGGAAAARVQRISAAGGAAEAGQGVQVDLPAVGRLEEAIGRVDLCHLRQVHGGAAEGLDVAAAPGGHAGQVHGGAAQGLDVGAAPGGHVGQVELAIGPAGL